MDLLFIFIAYSILEDANKHNEDKGLKPPKEGAVHI